MVQRGPGVGWGFGVGSGEVRCIRSNTLGRTLALQSFRITYLVDAKNLANFCTTRNKNILEKRSILV